MAQTIDEITIEYEEAGTLLLKELDKSILSRGAWTTIMFKFQEWNNSKNEYSPVKFSIRRYRKFGDSFSQQSKFNISNEKQAQLIIDTLAGWLSE